MIRQIFSSAGPTTNVRLAPNSACLIEAMVAGQTLTLRLPPTAGTPAAPAALKVTFDQAEGRRRWFGFRRVGIRVTSRLMLYRPLSSPPQVARVTKVGAAFLLDRAVDGRQRRLWHGIAYVRVVYDPHAVELAQWATTALVPRSTSEVQCDEGIAVVPMSVFL